MTWVTPKTDWTTNDGIAAADLNRIETNTQHANGNAADISGMSSITSANNLPVTKKISIISGTTAVHFLPSTGFVSGAVLFLYFTSTPAINHLQSSPPAGYAQIKTFTGAAVAAHAQTLYIANYDGTFWNIVGTQD